MRQRAFMPRNTLLCHSVVLPFAPWQILLQKSPRRSCRIKIRNNRIGANGFLNQRCALTPDLESILRTQTGKILLQQNRYNTSSLRRTTAVAFGGKRTYGSVCESRDSDENRMGNRVA